MVVTSQVDVVVGVESVGIDVDDGVRIVDVCSRLGNKATNPREAKPDFSDPNLSRSTFTKPPDLGVLQPRKAQETFIANNSLPRAYRRP